MRAGSKTTAGPLHLRPPLEELLVGSRIMVVRLPYLLPTVVDSRITAALPRHQLLPDSQTMVGLPVVVALLQVPRVLPGHKRTLVLSKLVRQLLLILLGNKPFLVPSSSSKPLLLATSNQLLMQPFPHPPRTS